MICDDFIIPVVSDSICNFGFISPVTMNDVSIIIDSPRIF